MAQYADINDLGVLADAIKTNRSALADKQPKTLATAITVDGTQETTVEGALGAINTLAAGNKTAIGNIKDGTTIDSFADVETALSGKQDKTLSAQVEGQSTVEGALGALSSNKADNSVIAPVENGTTVQKPGGYAVGSHAIRNGAFITWKNAKAQGETINDASDYDSGDVASLLTTEKAEATNPHADITLNTTYKYAVKNGKTVNFKIKFTLANDIASGSNVGLFTLPYLPNLQYLNFIIYDATADLYTTQFVFVGNTNGRVYVSKGLTAGGYEISGTYICQ